MTFEQLATTRLDVEINSNSSNGVYGTTYRQQAVNDGYREFAALTNCWVVRAAIPVSCNTAEIVLSTLAGFRQIDASGPEFRLTSSGSSGTTQVLAGKDDFPRRDEVWLNTYQTGWHSTTPGLPTGWYLRKDGGRLLVGFDRPPDVGSSDTAVLRVPYLAVPAEMTASTQVPFTDTSGTREDLVEYHQALAHYGASKLLPMTGRFEEAQTQFAKFMDYVKRYLANMRPKGGTHVTLARTYLQRAQGPRG